MCNDFCNGSECQHKITKEEIIQAIEWQVKRFEHDFNTSEMLAHEFMTGRQNN